MIPARAEETAAAPIRESHVLGMAEMGYRGLSEQWLMRRAGELHWRLIARAMGQRDAVFTCAAGLPIYAAFCATCLRLSQPEFPQLGRNCTLSASLSRLGRGRMASELLVTVEGTPVGRMMLISTFVGRSIEWSNRSVTRRAPRAMALPPEAGTNLRRFGDLAARVARSEIEIEAGTPSHRLLPCPATDFNAARLMYFPSYAALIERADFALRRDPNRMLVARDIIYLGNLEPGEAVDVRLRQRSQGHDAILYADDSRGIAIARSRFCAAAY